MIKKIKAFLKNYDFVKNYLMDNPLKKTFSNRESVVKKIWNNQNTLKKKNYSSLCKIFRKIQNKIKFKKFSKFKF